MGKESMGKLYVSVFMYLGLTLCLWGLGIVGVNISLDMMNEANSVSVGLGALGTFTILGSVIGISIWIGHKVVGKFRQFFSSVYREES
jgi:hypothetical protein